MPVDFIASGKEIPKWLENSDYKRELQSLFRPRRAIVTFAKFVWPPFVSFTYFRPAGDICGLRETTARGPK
jgi:hypothetical protein